jgi:hypothetical protein
MPQTGPTTPEGKARASLNAIKHGLTATSIIIPGLENEDDWQTFYDGVFAYYGPVGAVEFALVDRAAGLHWRLRRVPRAEREAILNPTQNSTDVTIEALREATRDFREQFGAPDLPFTDIDDSAPYDYRSAKPEVANAGPPAPPPPLPEPVHLLTLSKYEMRLGGQLRSVTREIENCQNRRRRAHSIRLHAL